jgi:hypothetical protein
MEVKRVKERMRRGRCPICRGVKNLIHTLLKCPGTKRWTYQFLSAQWLKINRKIVVCKSINKLRCLGKFYTGLEVHGKMRLVTKEGEWRMME